MLLPFQRLGTFTEPVAVREICLAPLPEDVPLDEASGLGCVVSTGLGAAVHTAKVEAGSSVAIFGSVGWV